jgi:outer membrane lipoprotein-sorting protein
MRLSFLVLGISVASATASAKTPEELLAEVDAKLTESNDQYLVWDLVTYEPGKKERKLTFQATVKGKHWRRVDFLAPADIKGMKILIRSPTAMYIYLPSFRKVRRVASHVQEQGFMGSSFDHAEVSLATYSDTFDAVGSSDHSDYFTLVLERKDPTYPHAKIEIDVDKKTLQVKEGRYFNSKGVKVKTETREKFVCSETYCTPHHVEMIDHTRGDLRSVMTLKKYKTNVGVPDSFFTVRSLQRGN